MITDFLYFWLTFDDFFITLYFITFLFVICLSFPFQGFVRACQWSYYLYLNIISILRLVFCILFVYYLYIILYIIYYYLFIYILFVYFYLVFTAGERVVLKYYFWFPLHLHNGFKLLFLLVLTSGRISFPIIKSYLFVQLFDSQEMSKAYICCTFPFVLCLFLQMYLGMRFSWDSFISSLFQS
jgi:hypothetical protein